MGPNLYRYDEGGLDDVKRRLQQAVEWPLKHADAFLRLGLSPPRGILLHGPPGCAKTTMARAAATASGATVVTLAAADVFSKYVGEGERTLRAAFARARRAAPAILLLDEIDGMVGSRGSGGGGDASDVGARILSVLLTVGLYKFNPVYPQRLKAPGFNP
jgi:SpoVK/Ycf46/Vps4 family AAA+-type ATPase